MRFSDPAFLIALIVVPAVVWVQRRGITSTSRAQQRVSLVVRSLMLVSLVFALAGASVVFPETRRATVFLLDRSDSMSSASRSRAVEFVRKAVASKPKDALAGVVVAGREGRVELTVQEDPELISVASDPDGSRTDLARGLKLAAALLPEGMRRRIVLLSDGRENSGDALSEAGLLRRAGVRVDTVTLAAPGGPDAAVVGIKGPARVRLEDAFDLHIDLTSNASMPARLTLFRQGSPIAVKDLSLEPGATRVSVEEVAADAGSVIYRAELRGELDSVGANDSGAALVIVSGPPAVMIVEGEGGEGDALAASLGTRGFRVERRSQQDFPTIGDLAAVESLILVDVDATRLTRGEMQTVDGFVRGLGRGLVAVGGESSWSLGGYRNTLLEDLLPVESEIKDPKRRPSIAQVLVIDASGSMADTRSGTSKIEIAKAAAARAAGALREGDELGILGFNTTSTWVLPLQKLPDESEIERAISRLVADGGTDIPQAIRAATKDVSKSKAALKHIILLSDGFNGEGDLFAAAAEAREAGTTLTAVGTGESAASDLEHLAQIGGGRFYPGRNIDEIPDLVLEEVVIASRRYVNEGEFVPKITGSSAATDRLRQSPALLGYIGTAPKKSASVLLSIGEYDDPLLATWRTGLGVATAWTSDAKGRWAKRWVPWEVFPDFWSNVVRETLPSAPTPGFSLRASQVEGGIEIIVESEVTIPEGTEGRAEVVHPDGTRSTVPLERSSLNRFAARATVSAEGAYLVLAQLDRVGRPLYRDAAGAIKSYSAEYLPGEPDRKLMGSLASTTGGRSQIRPEDAFRGDLPIGRRQIEVSGWLLLLCALLLPADIALRRLAMTREDLAAFFRRRVAESRPPEFVRRLAQAKSRAALRLRLGSRRFPEGRDRAAAGSQPVFPSADAGSAPEGARSERRRGDSREPASPDDSPQAPMAAELLKRKRERRERSKP